MVQITFIVAETFRYGTTRFICGFGSLQRDVFGQVQAVADDFPSELSRIHDALIFLRALKQLSENALSEVERLVTKGNRNWNYLKTIQGPPSFPSVRIVCMVKYYCSAVVRYLTQQRLCMQSDLMYSLARVCVFRSIIHNSRFSDEARLQMKPLFQTLRVGR